MSHGLTKQMTMFENNELMHKRNLFIKDRIIHLFIHLKHSTFIFYHCMMIDAIIFHVCEIRYEVF